MTRPNLDPTGATPPQRRLERVHPYGRTGPGTDTAPVEKLEKIPRPSPDRLRQTLVLTIVLLLVSGASALAYFRLFPGPRPPTTNDGNPIARISMPVEIYELGFVVHADTTTISASFDPTPITNQPITITYLGRDRPQLEHIDTGVVRDGNPRPAAWTVVPISEDVLELRPTLVNERISTIGLTFLTNRVVDIAERRHIRTTSWTIDAPEIRYSPLRQSPTGVSNQPLPGRLEIQTSGYNIEKVESTGRIGDQTLLGNFTSYSVSPDLNLISAPEYATIPATNVDMVDLQKTRDREASSLLIGALLGVAGALLVEVLLAGINMLDPHSSSSG